MFVNVKNTINSDNKEMKISFNAISVSNLPLPLLLYYPLLSNSGGNFDF